MPDPITGLVVGGTSLLGSVLKSDAASDAGEIQADSAAAGIEEQRRQFDAFQQILKPYVDAGLGALPGLQPYLDAGTGALPTLETLLGQSAGSMQGLETFLNAGENALPGLQQYAQGGGDAYQQQLAMLGLKGPGAQADAIAGLESSPMFQSIAGQGEDAILQNASATGGLRGGNVQGALAQFRPQLLNQFIDQQYGRLGGLAGAGLGVNQGLVSMGASGRESLFGQGLQGYQNLVSMGQQTQQNLVGLGQASAAGTGSAGLATGNNIASLLGESGAAQAGARLGQGEAWGSALNLPAQFMGLKMGMGGSGSFF